MPHLGWPSLWKQNPSLGNTGDDMPRRHLHDEGPVLGSPISQVKTSGCSGYITTGRGPQVSHHKAQVRCTFAKRLLPKPCLHLECPVKLCQGLSCLSSLSYGDRPHLGEAF